MNRISLALQIVAGTILMLSAACTQNSTDVSALSSPSESPRAINIDINPVARSELVPERVAILAFIMSGKVENTFVKVGDVVHRGDRLIQLDTTTLNTDVVRAEKTLKIAQTQYDLQMMQNKDVEAQIIADANVAIAEADLSRARYMLAQATLTAPFDGTIVSIQIKPGEIVTPGEEIVTLADLRSMQVETLDLNEMDVSNIFVGQTVEVYVNALDLTINGQVAAIALQTVQVGQNKTCKVTIHLDSQPQGLLWGMNADATFIIGE